MGDEWSAAQVGPELCKTHAGGGAGGDQNDGELHSSEAEGVDSVAQGGSGQDFDAGHVGR